jgi:hypothetical protein
MRRSLALGVAALTLALGSGCQSVPEPQASPAPAPSDTPSNDRDLAAAVVLADTFQSMQHLAQAAPAEQAEIVSAARDTYQRTPRGESQLRYALLLATPGHPARNAELAQRLLRELAAQPESLEPAERAVVMVELAQLDHELDQQAINQQLQTDALRTGQERSAADQRRLQAEVDENVRLRKELTADQAKLDAIATIERNLTQRKTGAEAGTEAGAAPAATAPANEGNPK